MKWEKFASIYYQDGMIVMVIRKYTYEYSHGLLHQSTPWSVINSWFNLVSSLLSKCRNGRAKSNKYMNILEVRSYRFTFQEKRTRHRSLDCFQGCPLERKRGM